MKRTALHTCAALLLLLGAIASCAVPASADGPAFLTADVFYPRHLANTNLRQTAAKDGDHLYISTMMDSPVVTTSVTMDLTPLGLGSAVPMDDVFDDYDFPTSNNLLRQFQGEFTVASGGFSGTADIVLTATDENGLVTTHTVSVAVDNTLPTASLSNITAASSSPLAQLDTLSVSGSFDGTGSNHILYQIKEQELAADGETVLYQSVYNPTHPSSPELFALSDGAFIDVPLRVYTSNGASTFRSDAYFLRFVLTLSDDADNYAFATSTNISIATPPTAATSTPDIGTSTDPVATSTPPTSPPSDDDSATTTPEVVPDTPDNSATSTPEQTPPTEDEDTQTEATTTPVVATTASGGRSHSSSFIATTIPAVPVAAPVAVIPIPSTVQVQTAPVVVETPIPLSLKVPPVAVAQSEPLAPRPSAMVARATTETTQTASALDGAGSLFDSKFVPLAFSFVLTASGLLLALYAVQKPRTLRGV